MEWNAEAVQAVLKCSAEVNRKRAEIVSFLSIIAGYMTQVLHTLTREELRFTADKLFPWAVSVGDDVVFSFDVHAALEVKVRFIRDHRVLPIGDLPSDLVDEAHASLPMVAEAISQKVPIIGTKLEWLMKQA